MFNNRQSSTTSGAQYSDKKIIDKSIVGESEIFKGFVGSSGGGFKTKKGFFGKRLDHLWSKQILDCLKTDDVEVLEIALQSSIADIHARVCGGEYGSPLIIGEYGFYARSQFEGQSELLKQIERQNTTQMKSFLSNSDWKIVDESIDSISTYSYSRFITASLGDTFATLAVRENAFLVASACLNRGVDYLLKNDKNEDLFSILRQQYASLTIQVCFVLLLSDGPY